MHNIITDGIAVASIITTLAIFVALVSRILRKIKPLSRMSVQSLSVIVSMVLCVAGYFAYCAYAGIPVIWYLAGDASVTGLLVALIAVCGQDMFERWRNKCTKE